MNDHTDTPHEDAPQKVGQALNTGWRKYYFPFVVAITAAVIGFLALAYISSQRFTQIEGFLLPTDVTVGANDLIYVTDAGEASVRGDGMVYRIEDGKPVMFAQGLNDPAGLVFLGNDLIVSDQDRIWRIPPDGVAEVWLQADAFEQAPVRLEDIVLGVGDLLYVLDSQLEVVFQIKPEELGEKSIESFVDSSNVFLDVPGDILFDLESESFWVGNFISASMVEFNKQRSVVSTKTGLNAISGLAQGINGIIYLSDATTGRIFTRTAAGREGSLIQGLERPTGLAFDATNNQLIVAETGANRITIIKL
jgi:DNA-binding beta-propeller fold protein YncE